MTPDSTPAAEAARTLWLRACGEDDVPEQVAAAAERIRDELRTALRRWIGGDGYRALYGRAFALASAEYPALASLAPDADDSSVATDAVRAHGAAQVAAGMVALLRTVMDLLGRIVGAEMAVRLVNQIERPSPRGVVRAHNENPGEERRDG